MKRKVLLIITMVIVSFGTLFSSSFVEASSKLNQLERQKKELESKEKDVKSEISATSEEIKELEGKVNSLNRELEILDGNINQTEIEIDQKTAEIEEKDAEIVALTEEIRIMEERIAKRDALLADRARAIQANGGSISYLEVLLGAQSFTDFIGRAAAVNTIMEADKAIIEEHKKDKENLEIAKQQLEVEREELEALKAELEEQKAHLEAQRKEKNNIIAQLKAEQATLEEYFMDLEEEEKLIAEQKAAVQKLWELEKKRIEEEKRRAQQSGKYPNLGTGKFIRPTTGRISSEFGSRIHPIYGHRTLHAGIDIANRTGTPVYASAGGIVARSYYSPSFGNVVFINHIVDGKVFTTVYAHLSKRGVESGEVVSQGQYIGDMGSTGDSTGPHLHFQIHEGEYSRSTAVNPRKYVKF